MGGKNLPNLMKINLHIQKAHWTPNRLNSDRFTPSTMDWTVSAKNSYAEALIPNVIVSRDGVFGR